MADEIKVTDRIKYDSHLQRVLKNHTPRISGGAAVGVTVATVVGAPLVIAGAFAGAGILALAGVGAVAVGTGVTAGNHYFNKAVFRKTFKRLEGDSENLTAIVEYINEYDNSAKIYRQLLNNHQGEKIVPIQDENGNIQHVKVSKVKKWIKENEEITYNGLKYLYDKALVYSNQLRDYLGQKKLNSAQEKSVAELYDKLAIIGEATVDVTIDRTDYNPYKKLIIDTLHNGCLIGVKKELRRYVTNDKVNKQIEAIKGEKDIEKVKELYSAVYETAAFRKLQEREEERKKAQEATNEDYQNYLLGVKLLDRCKGDLTKLSREERILAEKAQKIQYNQKLKSDLESLINQAKGYTDKLTGKMKTELLKAIASAEQALLSGENNKMLPAKNNLNKLNASAQQLVEDNAYKAGRNSLADEINAYKAQIKAYQADISRLEIVESASLKKISNYNNLYNSLERGFKALSQYKQNSLEELTSRAKLIKAFYEMLDPTAISDEDKKLLSNVDRILPKIDKASTEAVARFAEDINELHIHTYEILSREIGKIRGIVASEAQRANEAEARADREAELHKKATERGLNKRAENKSLKSENENLTKAQQAQIAEMQSMFDENIRLNKHLGLIQTFLDGEFASTDELKSSVDQLSAQIASLRKALTGAKKLSLEHLDEYKQAQSKLKEYEDAIKQLQVKLSQMKAAKANDVADKEAYVKIITKLAKQKEKLVDKVDSLEISLQTARSLYDAMCKAQEIDAKRAKNDFVKISELNDLKKKMEERILFLESKVKQLHESVTLRDQTIENLNEDINRRVMATSENIGRIIELELDVENKDGIISLLNADIDNAVKIEKKLKSYIAELQANITKLQEEVAYETHRRKQTEDELADSTKRLEEAIDAILSAEEQHKQERATDGAKLEKYEYEDYKFEKGGLEYRVGLLLDKIHAHVEYTKENQPNYDKQAVKDMIYYIEKLRTQLIESENGILTNSGSIGPMQELEQNYELTHKMYYTEYSKRLAPINAKKLNALAKTSGTLMVKPKSDGHGFGG